MSTRSGKRIHGSFHENNFKSECDIVLKSERKTRSKRLKEVCDENIVCKSKKRNNYVSYPVLDDDIEKASVSNKNVKENVSVNQNTTLKELNLNVSLHLSETDVDPGKFVRQTRRTKKFAENIEVTSEHDVLAADSKTKGNKKKSKKNKMIQLETNDPKIDNKEVSKVAKKSKQKRENTKTNNDILLNKSNSSSDSFHSAAGSPFSNEANTDREEPSEVRSKSLKRTLKRNKPDSDPELLHLDTLEKNSKKLKLSLDQNEIVIKNKSNEVSEQDKVNINKSDEETEYTLNATLDKGPTMKRKSSIKNGLLKESEKLKKKINTTYERDTPQKTNVTIESDSKSSRKSIRSSLVVENESGVETILNSTYDKTSDSTEPKLNTTFDKETKLNTTFEKSDSNVAKINTTFEKANSNSDIDKKSLISSDGSENLTYDKSSENSRISISDDSTTENIANTTPLLIESSMEESLERSIKQTETQNKSVTPDSKNIQPSITPLKREGTFTMESTDSIMSPKTKSSSEGTPTNRKSFPTAGCTPFHTSRNSQKDRSMLNLTHSIEKVQRRSSLAGPPGRTTKVMFCSPINNPAVVAQQKRKVIKSNLKGSNKSFIFDENVSQSVRPSTRKRSYTQNDAEDTRAKRKRLTDRQQQAADRLSRPRTSSATVKPTEPSSPSKKVVTPFKRSTPSKIKTDSKLSRTKLPNFAALHQKQFAKMESLDECQERKAKRAKQLLTPNGAVTVLERSSPKNRGSIEQAKSTKEAEEKPETPKILAPQTQKQGFTRFGFKLNKDTNPFNFTAKTETKPKENRPNGLLTRQPSQPSLTGGTSMRREVAKQTVMREKSFTSLSDKRSVTRKENRTMIKGVRTNRRFELQMMMRNINA